MSPLRTLETAIAREVLMRRQDEKAGVLDRERAVQYDRMITTLADKYEAVLAEALRCQNDGQWFGDDA